MKNKSLYQIVIALFSVITILIIACKRDGITGVKTKETGAVYFPDADSGKNGIVAGLNAYTIDTSSNTIAFSVPVFRGGFSDLAPFTVNIGTDNSSIPGLVQSGLLPTNTVALDTSDYILAITDTLSLANGLMQGTVAPKIKVENLGKYSGKYAAVGIVVKSSDKFSVNAAMNKAVVYFPVDSLVGQVYFPGAITGSNSVLNLGDNYVIDSVNNTINYPVSISRGGIADLATSNVTVSVDNSNINNLVSSGALPSNTIALASTDYTLNNTVAVSNTNGKLQGTVLPKINIAKLCNLIF